VKCLERRFNRLNHDSEVAGRGHRCRGDRRSDVRHRRPLDRTDRGRNLCGLAPGEAEESGQDLVPVLLGDHPCDLDDGSTTSGKRCTSLAATWR
jgi:hypothetical protein